MNLRPDTIEGFIFTSCSGEFVESEYVPAPGLLACLFNLFLHSSHCSIYNIMSALLSNCLLSNIYLWRVTIVASRFVVALRTSFFQCFYFLRHTSNQRTLDHQVKLLSQRSSFIFIYYFSTLYRFDILAIFYFPYTYS
jgi:hypothetical protein